MEMETESPKRNESKKGMALVMILILAFGVAVGYGFYYLEEKQDQKELELYFNGSVNGAMNIINRINETNSIPFILPNGKEVGYISFNQLCLNLNYVKGGI